MSVPGINVLALALGVLGSQTVDYYRDAGRAPDDDGEPVTIYDAPVPVVGSFQPIDGRAMQAIGLDMDKSWAVFRAPLNGVTPVRDQSGDQLAYFGRRYQITGKTDWFAQDGWTALLCVDIGPDA